MTSETTIVANIALSASQPTVLSFDELSTWVIWQFPRKKDNGLCGAVHPSIAEHGWYPAIVLPKEKRVKVFGHLDTLFDSPEKAGEYLTN